MSTHNLIDVLIEAPIIAIILGSLVWFISQAGLSERKRNLKKAILDPTHYPNWKKEGINFASSHLRAIEEICIEEPLLRKFTTAELDGIEAFSPIVFQQLIQYKELPVSEAIKNTKSHFK